MLQLDLTPRLYNAKPTGTFNSCPLHPLPDPAQAAEAPGPALSAQPYAASPPSAQAPFAAPAARPALTSHFDHAHLALHGRPFGCPAELCLVVVLFHEGSSHRQRR